MNISRNAPCPCGSGKKYKKCCIPKDESASPEFIWHKIRQAEADLLNPLMKYAVDRFDDNIMQYAWEMFWLEPVPLVPGTSIMAPVSWHQYHGTSIMAPVSST